jgi:NADH-quinone oxidoreductase subunit E
MKLPGDEDSPRKAARIRKTGSPDNRRPGGSGTRIDPEVARWLTGAGAAFPASRSSIIPMLQSAQAALGYLPPDAMQAIARHVVAPAAVIEGVASFYAQFRFEKPGRHRVTVCSGTACYVRGSGKLMDDLRADLKIAPGGTTADGAVTLESVACFGACALAPVVVLDDRVLRQQTSASIRKTIRDLSADPVDSGAAQAPAIPVVRGAPE